MNKKLTFTGGEPDITIDNLLYDPEANRAALFGVLLGLSGAVDSVISGAAVTLNPGVDASVTAGYVWLGGEILQVDAATVAETEGTDLWEFQKQVTFDSAGDKTFNDATPRQTYQKNRAVLVNVTSVTGMDAVNAPSMKGETSDGIRREGLEIGAWDMDATAQVSLAIPAGIDPTKIDSVEAWVYDDDRIAAGTSSNMYSLFKAGDVRINRTLGTWAILLDRTAAGFFDSIQFDTAVGNRGRVIINYRE